MIYRLLGRTGLRVSPLALGAMTFGQKRWGADEDTARALFRHLYWMHLWDTVTPVEEVMAAFDAVVPSGKVRAIGQSDVPAWYLAKAQLEYSLVERQIEREHAPAAADLGVAVIPWSPLAGGFLTGKYSRGDENAVADAGRLDAAGRPELYQPYILFDADVAGAIATPGFEVRAFS